MILTDKSERVKNLIFSIMKLLILPTADPKRVSNVPSSTVDLKQLCLQILLHHFQFSLCCLTFLSSLFLAGGG